MSNLIAIIMLFLFPIESKHLYRGQYLPDGYKPKQSTELSVRSNWLNSKNYIDTRVVDKLNQLILDAEKDGVCLVVSSGYRSFEYQKKVYETTKDKTSVAIPGQSEHQTGLAVDFNACPMKDGVRDDNVERLELKNDFETLPEYQWLKDNAEKYGIEESFRTDNQEQTGYKPEHWHWKFMITK